MTVEILEESPSALAQYATVPIAFEVREVLAVGALDDGLGGLRLTAREPSAPYVKDYDADPANHPSQWPSRFDLARWGFLAAWTAGSRVGGAVIAWSSPGVAMLEGRDDLAVLWDLRVAPGARGKGIGASLFRAAEQWAVARGAAWLKVETQNINVPACRFYARQGCTLGALHRFAYASLPDEAQLLWYKPLVAPPAN
jgi:ribosomal protein S18 acetylase RimI-like enzyme